MIKLANRHPRVNILQPGPGVGGHCIAVDPYFIIHGAPEQSPLIRTGREVNDAKMHHVVARAEQLIADNPGVPVACLGLAFKANIDDFRESPARFVASRLARKFGVDEDELRTRLSDLRRQARRPSATSLPAAPVTRYELSDLDPWDREILELVTAAPDALLQLEEAISAGDLISPLGRKLYAKCLELRQTGMACDLDRLMLETEDLAMKDFLVRLDEQARAKREASVAQRVDDILRTFRRRKEDQQHQQTIAALEQGALDEGESEAALADLVASLRARHGKSAPMEG